nr:MAG TPA: hypothetical protein [Caudoviricetes sp.]
MCYNITIKRKGGKSVEQRGLGVGNKYPASDFLLLVQQSEKEKAS